MSAQKLRPGAYRVTIKSRHISVIVLAAHPCDAICIALELVQ